MPTAMTDTLPPADRDQVRRALTLVTTSLLLLLAAGGLLARWGITDLPLALTALAAATRLLLRPDAGASAHDGEHDLEATLHSLVLASLITLSGLHLAALA